MKLFYTFAILLSSLFSNAQIKYVTKTGSGSKDGSSWGNAWSGQIFSDTLYSVAAGTQLWVAKGTYNASKDSTGALPDSTDFFSHKITTFIIPSGVKMFGGFAGTETSLSQRVDTLMHSLNNTVLDGYDPLDPDYYLASDYVIILKNVDKQTVVDGFSIYHGYYTNLYIESKANGSSEPLVKNCLFTETDYYSYGNLWMNESGSQLSQPTVLNCYFVNGHGLLGSGGINVMGNCHPLIANTVFVSCFGAYGNCIAFQYSRGGDISNCGFYNSTGEFSATLDAAVACTGMNDTVAISNSIFWNNQNKYHTISNFQISGGTNNLIVNNCDIQPQDPNYSVEPSVINNSIALSPQLTDSINLAGLDGIYFTSDDGFNLKSTSPCRETGLNNLISSMVSKDIFGKKRVSGCTVDMGAAEFQLPVSNVIILPENTFQNCTQYPVSDSGTVYTDPITCSTTAALQPMGGNPVSGTVKVCVTKDAAVQVVNGVPYVQRHYDIEPLQNGSTATARITLYFTQSEFDNYNVVATGLPQLPTSPTDLSGISHIKVEQDHGFSVTGVPGTYSGSTVYIDPVDTDITWNAPSNIWAVSFDITGFSGFFISTVVNTIPVKLASFSAKENSGTVQLRWQTVMEINSKYFDVQRSADGTNFTALGKVTATGNALGSVYQFDDMHPGGLNYYRLTMVDVDGNKKYSPVVLINLTKTENVQMLLAPNPTKSHSNLTVSGKLKGSISIAAYDVNGRKIKILSEGQLSNGSFSTILNLESFPKGLYVIELCAGDQILRRKLVVE